MLRRVPGPDPGDNTLQPGVPKTGLGASTNTSLNYTITVPAGRSQLRVTTTGSNGDADLYVRAGSAPTDSSYTCRSWASGSHETCVINNPAAGVWHVRIKAYSTFSNVTLNATY